MEIRRGITRTVLLVGKWAIKVPSLQGHDQGLRGVLQSFCRGLLANVSEADFTKYGNEGICPVKFSYFGLVNIYPRCVEQIAELTEEQYKAIGYLGPMDKKPSNVGWLNGELVWLDYDQSWNDRPPCEHIKRK